MAIEIKITPRKVERAVLIAIIILLVGYIYYYSPQCENAPAVTPPKVVDNATAPKDTVKEESVKPAPAPSTTTGLTDSKITMEIPKLDAVKDGERYNISSFSLLVRNGKTAHLTGVTLDLTKYEKVDIEEGVTLKPHVNIKIGTIPSGGSASNTFRLTPSLKLYGTGKLKFELKQGATVLATVTKDIS